MRRKRSIRFPFIESGPAAEPAPPNVEGMLYVILGRLASALRRCPSKTDERRITRERWKIVNWLCPERGRDLNAETLLALRDLGLSSDRIERARTEMQKRRRGRPVSQRYAAIQALQARLRTPDRSYAEIASEVCRCSRKVHGTQCTEDLRAEVRRLKRFLRNYGYL